MERIEYRNVVDKADWPRGPWDNEPDKIQWQDEATGLPCLIVRGPSGALCGYVGVPNGHPLHHIDYGQCPRPGDCADRDGGRGWCDHTPESSLNAHGGVTFASGCSEINREVWGKFCERLNGRRDEAKQYPKGDAARYLKEWATGLENYEAWAERATARYICHKPAPGEPDDVWWFGFDCAHLGDVSPAFDRLSGRGMSDGVYRDIAYVELECRNLARQLAGMSAR